MVPVFLSYSRKDLEDVFKIGQILTVGGISTWQDINSLSIGSTEDQIRKAIHEDCFSFLFYATDNSLSSNFIRNVEIKEAYKRTTQDKVFTIVPLFGKSIDEVNSVLKGIIPVDISTFNGAILKEDDNNLSVASQGLRKILLRRLLEFNNNPVLNVALMTKQTTPGDLKTNLDFNWFKIFANEELLTQNTWNTYIHQALIDAKDSIVEAGITNFNIISKAHLSVGFAFGFIFRRVAGFKLNVQQGEQWWFTHDSKNRDLKVNISTTPGNITSNNLGIDISISQDVQGGMWNFIKKNGISFRAIIRCVPKKGSSQFVISNSSDAVTLAKNIADSIRKANADYGTTDIHIFAAIPLGLAYLIGSELNACGRIHLYEFNNSTREYSPSWVIEGTD